MKVLVWPAGVPDEDASTMYRLVWPAKAAAAQGADVTIDRTGPTVLWDRKWPGADQAVDPPGDVNLVGVRRPDADVVVLQRPGRRWWADMIPHLQAHSVRVVVDVDDRFDVIHQRNVARRAYRARADAVHSHEHIDRACRLADRVVCSTPALAARYGYGHGVVAPNLVPASYLEISADRLERTVGWTGSIGTHPADLQTTSGAVGSVVRSAGWRFHVVGTGAGVQQALRLPAPPTSTGWVPLPLYPLEYARLTVAIVPLEPSDFNESKSCLKMLEAASLGVPVVASPTWDNRRLHDLGVGILASSPGQWRRRLTQLLASEETRSEVAAAGRAVAAELTYEKHADRWWSAWTEPCRQPAAV